MAAPTITALGTPAGNRQKDGFPTAIAFARLPTASFWEVEVTPGDVDGGDPIDSTTMRNVRYHTMRPRTLVKTGPMTLKVSFDEDVYLQVINTLINAEDSITIHFPDGSTEAFYGYLKDFKRGPHKEGDRPEADMTIVKTNWDSANNLEVGPLYTAASGT